MKKLAWFHYPLITLYGTQNRGQGYDPNTYLSRCMEPPADDANATAWHVAMRDITDRTICLVDQTNLSRDYGDGLDLARLMSSVSCLPKSADPESGKYVDMNFAAAAHQRVNDMFDQADAHGLQEIRISWSGGIDSNFVLAAIVQHPRSQIWLKENRIKIYTTSHARREDPTIWNWIMQSGMPVQFLNYDRLVKDTGPWMLVTGEGEPYGTMFSRCHEKTLGSPGLFWNHWTGLESHFLAKDPSGLGWEYFQALMKLSPVPIESCFHAWWWFENCVESQCYLFRLNAYSDTDIIDPDLVFPGTKTFWFMASQEFTDHGIYMAAHGLQPEDPLLVKPHLRQYVADWQGWAQAQPKARYFSQWLVPKRVHKWRIHDDFTWDRIPNLVGARP